MSRGRPRAIAVAFGFLTRIPIGNGAVDAAALGRALIWFPIVGLALGLVARGAAHAAAGHLSPTLAAIVVVALLALVTGGLHLDGVADVFDGMGGGRGDRARTLAIMRDSRIGAHGATALVLVLGAKIAAVAALLPAGATWALGIAPIVARWIAVPLIVGVPYARPSGLGRTMHDHGRAHHVVIATAITAAALACAGARAIVPTAAAVVAAVALARWVHRHLGGLTGDVYGAAIELAELAFLIAASVPRGAIRMTLGA